MRLDGVYGDEGQGRNEQMQDFMRFCVIAERQPDKREAQRIKQEAWQRRREIVVPRRDAPVGGRPQNGIVVEASEFRPQRPLPKVRVDRHRECERRGEGADKDDDELPQAEEFVEEQEKASGSEEDGELGAEDGSGEDEEGDGLAAAGVGLFGVVFGEEEG